MNVFNNVIVKSELERLNRLKNTDGYREVQQDIFILKKALSKINLLIVGMKDYVKIEVNMWNECHYSLYKIMEHLHLETVELASDYDNNLWVLKHAE